MTTFSKKWIWKKVQKEKELRQIFEHTIIITQRLLSHNPNTQLRLQFLINSAILRYPTYDRSN